DSSGIVLSFGGEVMKNVAGYDVSRLLAGSLGVFGALTELSIKVAPKPFNERTYQLEVTETQALDCFGKWRGLPIPINCTDWVASDDEVTGRVHVRFTGTEPPVQSGAKRIGGEAMGETDEAALRVSSRGQPHSFYAAQPLWRVAVPPQPSSLPAGPTLIER